MKSNLRAVDNSQPHARDIARQRVKEWRSNAEREGWPVSNAHDVHGAPLLDRDGVVRASVPNHAEPEVKTQRGWWGRLFGR